MERREINAKLIVKQNDYDKAEMQRSKIYITPDQKLGEPGSRLKRLQRNPAISLATLSGGCTNNFAALLNKSKMHHLVRQCILLGDGVSRIKIK